MTIEASAHTVKVVAQTETGPLVAGYGVVFDGIDLYNTRFTKDTDFGPFLAGGQLPVFYDHSIGGEPDHQLGQVVRARPDDKGLWIEAQLDKSQAYVKEVLDLIEQGVIGWSSGSAGHLVRMADDGATIRQWPIVEFSLTATPAEPRTIGVQQLRARQQEVSKPLNNEEKDMSNELTTRLEAVENALRNLPAIQRDPSFVPGDTASDSDKTQHQRAFLDYVRTGDRQAIRAYRALQESTEASGGYLVPESVSDQVYKKLYEMSTVRLAGARVWSVAGTDSWAIPDMDFSGDAVLTREGGEYDEDEPSLNLLRWHPHKFTRITRATEELIEDSRVDVLQSVLIPDATRAFAGAENTYFITGSGASEPQGVLNAASVGVTTTSATSILGDEWIDTYYSLNHLYRDNAVWVMNDKTAGTLRKFKSGDGSYLWVDSLQFGQPSTFLGKRVFISNKIPEIGSGERVAIFGDFSYYWIVDFGQGEMSVMRIDQLYAKQGQLAFRWKRRMDGKIVDSNAFTVLQMA